MIRVRPIESADRPWMVRPNQIEPSSQGGEKIARAIAEFLEQVPAGGRTQVFI